MKHAFTVLSIALFATAPAFADDPLLKEAVEFSGQIFFIDKNVPGMVIAAVREDESTVLGFGEVRKGSGIEPNGDTRIGVGSITKTFTGLSLAHLVADGTARMTDTVGPHEGVFATLPSRDGNAIRLIDLVTHSSGLPRELEPVEGADKYSDQSFAANLEGDPLLFTPGTGMLYSNIGFDVLAMALSDLAGMPYADYLQQQVLEPIGLQATSYAKQEGQNVMTGYDWNGNEMYPGEPFPNKFGASSLETTANDMVRYLQWNLDRFNEQDAEVRALSHAAWTMRDGMDPVYGLDGSGHMSALGLGWVIMMPEKDAPLIIQKSGGADGIFSYIAFAPSRGVGVFISINKFDFSAGAEIATVANKLITALAPR
nr:D-alanyl-D-alanine-carboxypeptidase/endopeptidase AmpH [Marinicella sp. W31]MDC2876492.1 D-alanyl-D-alanine-carboxypeptidase/endopeptidase AmpH [Marinicella sp. W31]